MDWGPWVLGLSAIVSCTPPEAPPPQVPASAPATEGLLLDEAAAKAQAQAFFASVDGRDREAFRALTGEGFVLFEDGYATSAEALSKGWSPGNNDRPARSRRCDDEQVRRGTTTVTYLGDCTESQPAQGDMPAQTWRGWNTVVLAREGDDWKVVLWQWQKGGAEAERDRYNDAYRRKAYFVETPNRLLAGTVEAVAPGSALVLAMGQGRNALYLAEKGWTVTGVDISDEGIRLAEAAAASRGLTLTATVADIDGYDFGVARWDLVTMVYAGGDHDWIRRAKEALKPGGLFVFEFAKKDPDDPSTGPFAGVEPGELVAQFAGWQVLRDEVVEDVADWGKREVPLVRFVARKP
ncbi:MAG: methyltransferase domain-containing protein [Myxococcales bacterium]|nr:methyltransferase domain-containing protein [Myxococcales bacterium]